MFVLPEKLKFGVMWDDGVCFDYLYLCVLLQRANLFVVGVVPPSPACLRALNVVVRELRAAGHEVVDLCV